MLLCFEPSLGIDRSHASGASGGYCLPIDPIDYIPRGKDAIDISVGRTGADLEVTKLVHVELADEDRRVGLMADGHEDSVCGKIRNNTGLEVLQADTTHSATGFAMDFLHYGVPDECDLWVFEGPLLHDFRCAELIAPMHYRHFAAEAGEERRLLHRSITATYYYHLLVFEEGAVASGTRTYPVACSDSIPRSFADAPVEIISASQRIIASSTVNSKG
jgi:hypothetical protein